MDCLQLFQVNAILGSSSEALEADDAWQRGHPNGLTFPFDRLRSLMDRGKVEGRSSPAKDVDDASAAIYTQVLRLADLVDSQLPPIGQAARLYALEEAHNRLVGFLAVGDEEVRVSGSADEAVEDHAEATDYDVLQARCIGVGYDTGEIRTRELVLGHCQP